MPKRVINAFLAAEDKTFYTHPGVDLPGVINAVWTNVKNLGDDRRPVGASTITQQVTKNFLLTNEVSYKRKIREMILALRIEKAFTKDRILELYLNQIYLGSGNYGVATAALNYFNKSLDELTIGEAAYLGALPKAPNNYNIVRDHQAALDRRNWVIDRMREDGHITAEEADAAKAEPLELHMRARDRPCRRRLLRRGSAARDRAALRRGRPLQEGPRDPRHHRSRACRSSPTACCASIWSPMTRRQGYRGPLQHVDSIENWQKTLADLPPMPWLYSWQPAIVTEATKATATIGFKDGTTGEIKVADLGWAHPRSAGRPPWPRAQRDHRHPEGRRHHRGRAAGRGRQDHSRPLRAAPGAGDQRRDGRDGSAHRPRAGDDRRLVVSAIASSTAPPRRSASRARPSSRSSIWRRWSPASRRRP